MDRPMGAVKYKITKIDKPCFFLKLGSMVVVDHDHARIYSEDRKSYLPLDMALALGLDAELVKESVGAPKELKETIELMISSDYKERFKAEYWQLVIRYTGLKAMLEKWDAGLLDFKPTCSRSLYDEQLTSMYEYICILEQRAFKEDINLG